MLKELYDYGMSINILDRCLFTNKPVPWVVDIDASGDITGATLTKTKEQKGGAKFDVPIELKKRSSGIVAAFIVDKSEYVFGITEANNERKFSKLENKRQEYLEWMNKAAEKTGTPELKSVLKCLSKVEEDCTLLGRHIAPADSKKFVEAVHVSGKKMKLHESWLSSDLLLFRCNGKLVHLIPKVKEFWENEVTGSFGDVRQCLITGEMLPTVENHPPIKGVPGTVSSGTPLVSFNDKSFESYGWKGGRNAPISGKASLVYNAVFQDFVYDKSHHYTFPSGVMALFWSRENVDWFSKAMGGDSEVIKELYESPYSGSYPDIENEVFTSAFVRGSVGRIAHFGLMEQGFLSVRESVARFYQDVSVSTLEKPLTMWKILKCAYGDAKPPNDVECAFYKAIISSSEYPKRVFIELLLKADTSPYAAMVATAYARAYLNRKYQNDSEFIRLEEDMNDETRDPGYWLGAILAMVEFMQRIAINKPKAKLANLSRYKRALRKRPRLHLPRILDLASYYTSKAKMFKKEERLATMVAVKLSTCPKKLTREQEAMYEIGYCAEKKRLIDEARKNKEEREAKGIKDNESVEEVNE